MVGWAQVWRGAHFPKRSAAVRDEPLSISSKVSDDLDRLRIVEPDEEIAPVRRRGWLRWLLALVALGLIGTYLWPRLRESASPEVKLVAVTERELGLPPVVLGAVGYVVPEREITIAANTQGKIVEMPVAENEKVRAGDLVARLESDDERANLQLALAQRDDAARDLRVSKQLFDRGVRTENELERAQTTYNMADARVAIARAALDNTVLRAPFDGTIVRKLRDVGELLTLGVTAQGDPGTAIVTLADLEPLYVELDVNESEISKLSEGMNALVVPESRPDRRYTGTLVEIAARADRSKGVVLARVRIDDADQQLLPNMTTRIRFLDGPPAGEITVRPAVPRSAVVQRGGRSVVFVVEDDRARMVPVRIADDEAPAVAASAQGGFSAVAMRRDGSGGAKAPAEDDFVALLGGPDQGDYVIESPPAELATGSAVRIAP
jgi:HlyD family secretion protein